MRYSQRKKRRERRVQRAVRASMTQIGGRMLPGPMPRNPGSEPRSRMLHNSAAAASVASDTRQ